MSGIKRADAITEKHDVYQAIQLSIILLDELTSTLDTELVGKMLKIVDLQMSTVHEAYAKKHFADATSKIKIYQTKDETQYDLATGSIDAV